MVFTTNSATSQCKSVTGREILLRCNKTISGTSSPVSYEAFIDYNGSNSKISVLSNLFVGLTPWIITLLIYSIYTFEGKKLSVFSLLLVICCCFYLHFCYPVQEHILAVKDIGIQTSCTYFTGRKLSEFYLMSTVDHIVLKQSIKSQLVSYLAVHLKKSNKTVLKPLLLLGLEEEILKLIYQDIQKVLYDKS